MPVSGNEEYGVLARQSSNSSSGVPIKKRWYSMVQPPSPARAELPSPVPNERESKAGESALKSCDSTGKSDTAKSFLLEAQKEKPSGVNVDSQSTTVQPFLPIAPEANPDTSSSSLKDVDNQVNPALAENLASQEALVTAIVNVKSEVVTKQGESDCKLDLPADSGHFELSLGPNEPCVSSLVAQNTEGSCLMPETGRLSLLSLSLNKGEDISQGGSCKNGLNNNDADDTTRQDAESSCLMPETGKLSLLTLSLNKGKDISQGGSCKNRLNNNDADDTTRTSRSNWDLNTPMDSWEGSGDDVPVQDASHIDLLRKTSGEVDRKPCISSPSVIGTNGDKGKQVVGASEQEFNFPIPSVQPILPYKSADVLRLSLGSTLREFDSSVPQSLAKVDSSKFSPNSSLLKNLSLNKNTSSPTCKIIKSEPVEGTLVQANTGTASCAAGTLEANLVKAEVERQNLQSIELSTKGSQKILEQKTVKCEPLQEVSQENCITSDVTSHQSVGRVVQLQESSSSSSSSTLAVPLTPQKGCPSRLSACSDLSVSGDLSTQSDYSVYTKETEKSKNGLDLTNAEIAVKDTNFDLKESNVSSDKVEASASEGKNIEDHMVYKFMQDPNHLVATGEGSANVEEKICISAGTEEECYGSDYESDGNHAFGGHVDTECVGCGREDEEYEDGEVREPMMPPIIEDPIAEGIDSEKNNECSSRNAHSAAGFSGVGESNCINSDEKDYSMPDHIETNDDLVKGCDEKGDKIDYKDGNLQGQLVDREETAGADEQSLISAIQLGPLDQSGITDVQDGSEKDVLCDEVPAESGGAGKNVGEADNNENIRGSDIASTLNSLQNAETSVNANSCKDLSNVGSKSRIINLPRASNVTSPSNVRTIAGRSLSSRSGRERYFDMEDDKFHLRRNRDETYSDGPKFVRDRIQDRSFGSSRVNFMRGRGRGSARFDNLRSEWDSGRDFDSYGSVSDYRFRRKRAAAVGESEIERNDYDARLDGAAFASNRRRKPLNDALPSFRHPPARRMSPNGREDASMDMQMLRRVPRNISPSRCSGEDGSELVGLRHSEKFIRDFPADISDPIYSRQQSMYDGPDCHFSRCNTKFTTMQRRGFSRLRSKSPVRSRTRSPGPWSSPRRRLTEGFNGLPDSSQHRSPAIYREDRMRSSPRTTFTEEMVPRRRDSPSYTGRRLNDMRDADAVQEHGHPRSLSSRRSPPDRVFTRSNRRHEILDRRERADGDEFFGGPVHTGRFAELRGGGNADERRKYGERRGPVRSFRPYNSENDNHRFHPDDGPRPFRLYPEADSEYNREREFDANIKDRPLPRRMRNVEEQEGNFRQSGQLWHEEGFDVSRLKRRRF